MYMYMDSLKLILDTGIKNNLITLPPVAHSYALLNKDGPMPIPHTPNYCYRGQIGKIFMLARSSEAFG